MHLTFQLADPQGEAALLVRSPVPPQERPEIARRLLALQELQPKSVAFLTSPTGQGALRVETADGSFPGSALLQAAMAFAVERGFRRERKFTLETAGWEAPLTVHPNPLTGQVTAEFPLPQVLGKRPFLDQEVPLLQFPGTACVIWKEGPLPAEDLLGPALRDLAHALDLPAAVAVAWAFRQSTLHGACFSLAIGALTFPQCCAASAAAVAAWQSREGREGTQKFTLHQPGGTLQAAATVQRSSLRRLTVSGPVVLGPVYDLAF